MTPEIEAAATEAAYGVLESVVRIFRDLGASEAEIRERIGGGYQDQYRHTLDAEAYEAGRAMLERAIEETRP